MSPAQADALARAAAALQQAAAALAEASHAAGETSAAPRNQERRLLTVPKAAKATSVSEETIRQLIRAGRIPERLAGANPNPRRPTYLVFADEVLRALERPQTVAGARAGEEAQPIDLQKHAARVRARAEKRGG